MYFSRRLSRRKNAILVQSYYQLHNLSRKCISWYSDIYAITIYPIWIALSSFCEYYERCELGYISYITAVTKLLSTRYHRARRPTKSQRHSSFISHGGILAKRMLNGDDPLRPQKRCSKISSLRIHSTHKWITHTSTLMRNTIVSAWVW